MSQDRVYVCEFNRTYADNIRKCARRLERWWGLNVDFIPHKTTLRVERPPGMSWETLQGRAAFGHQSARRRGAAFQQGNRQRVLVLEYRQSAGVIQTHRLGSRGPQLRLRSLLLQPLIELPILNLRRAEPLAVDHWPAGSRWDARSTFAPSIAAPARWALRSSRE
jgi:hypothetical protein